jgi:hypothetical protein
MDQVRRRIKVLQLDKPFVEARLIGTASVVVLRVVDASMVPNLVGGNINALVVLSVGFGIETVGLLAFRPAVLASMEGTNQ